jgi:hypothetical protein
MTIPPIEIPGQILESLQRSGGCKKRVVQGIKYRKVLLIARLHIGFPNPVL